MFRCVAFAAIFFSVTSSFSQAGVLFSVKSGKIIFESAAPFETIKAVSEEVQGLLDVARKQFAFRVKMETFHGFNSALQREHFNENYIESDKFPEASFSGKLIEDVDLSQDGSYEVRAKGKFIIHGIAQERIIKSNLTVKNGKIILRSAFTVLLSDHNIPIPKVVKDKLSSEINVQVNCTLEAK